MSTRLRKRKICSCCESPQSVTSPEPDNAAKRRRVEKTTTEPVTESIVEQQVLPVNTSSQLVSVGVFSPSVKESSSDIVFESAGHSTRRMTNRRRLTVRGKKCVHHVMKEVTYTFATTRLDYVGQELIPFRERPNFFQNSVPDSLRGKTFITSSDKHDSPDRSVKHLKKNLKKGYDINDNDLSYHANNDNEGIDRNVGSSFVGDFFKMYDSEKSSEVNSDSGSDSSVGRSSVSDDDSDVNSDSGSDSRSDGRSSVSDDDSKKNDSEQSSDVNSESDSDSSSVGRASLYDDDFKANDSSSDVNRDSDYVDSSFETSSIDDRNNGNDSSFDENSNNGRCEKSQFGHNYKTDFPIFDNESDTGSDNKRGESSVDDNDSVKSESSFVRESSLKRRCFSKFGYSCKWHNRRSWDHDLLCMCELYPCAFDIRPEPTVCPMELETLQKVMLSQSKEEWNPYSILQEVKLENIGSSPCVYLYSNELITICNRQQSNLRIDRTFNLGHCYVTMFAFRHGNLISNGSKSEYGPLMTGPVMIHFDKSFSTYYRFFDTIKEAFNIEKKPGAASISDMSHVPKKEHVITKAMRLCFGTNVSWCSNHIVPISLRSSLKNQVACDSPLDKVIEVVHSKMQSERNETKQAILGIKYAYMIKRSSGLRVTERAKDFIVNLKLESHEEEYKAFDRLHPE